VAGSAITVSSRSRVPVGPYCSEYVEKVVIDWTADDTDGSVPALSVTLSGFVLKAVTDPGSTAPTDNYDIVLNDAADTTVDHLASALANRDTANTEVAYPTVSGATVPVWLEDKAYSLAVSNNSVNSATGQIILYLSSSA
jgi:hypothetical protein